VTRRKHPPARRGDQRVRGAARVGQDLRQTSAVELRRDRELRRRWRVPRRSTGPRARRRFQGPLSQSSSPWSARAGDRSAPGGAGGLSPLAPRRHFWVTAGVPCRPLSKPGAGVVPRGGRRSSALGVTASVTPLAGSRARSVPRIGFLRLPVLTSRAMAFPGRDRRCRTASTRVVRDGEAVPGTESPWEDLSPGERFAFAFQLSLQQWRLAGWRDDRPGDRLSRPVAIVRRP
jgi:hypothetical protein